MLNGTGTANITGPFRGSPMIYEIIIPTSFI